MAVYNVPPGASTVAYPVTSKPKTVFQPTFKARAPVNYMAPSTNNYARKGNAWSKFSNPYNAKPKSKSVPNYMEPSGNRYSPKPKGNTNAWSKFNNPYGVKPAPSVKGTLADKSIDWKSIHNVFDLGLNPDGSPRVKAPVKLAPRAAKVAPKSAPRVVVRATTPVVKAPAPIVTPPKVATAAPKPAVKPPAKPPTKTATGPKSNVGTSKTAGGRKSTYGQFKRQRNARGPRSGLSVTPEMLRRAAAQRLG